AALVRPAAVAVASPSNDAPLPPPETGRPFQFPFFNDPVSYHAAMETRLVRGAWGSGRAAAWMRQRLPRVAGTGTSHAGRVLGAPDIAPATPPRPERPGFPGALLDHALSIRRNH